MSKNTYLVSVVTCALHSITNRMPEVKQAERGRYVRVVLLINVILVCYKFFNSRIFVSPRCWTSLVTLMSFFGSHCS